MMRVIEFWINNSDKFTAEILRHLALVVASVGFAVLIGVPSGIFAFRYPRLGSPLIGIANIVQTIPSMAMFGFLIPLPLIGGLGAKAALVVLILYGLLPVMRTTVSGLKSIDPSIREAGMAMGMTSPQLLSQVEMPLAFPAILAGIRVATVVGVGTATIAGLIGAGGLGEFIYRGLQSVNATLILAGSIPAALLALIADFALGWMERAAAPGRTSRLKPRAGPVMIIGLIASVLAVAGLVISERTGDRIVIGSKGFTEQITLGEMMAQLIERGTSLKVARKFNLGDTIVCESAMRAGGLDLYVEYTGTALTEIFKLPVKLNIDEVTAQVAAAYAASGRTMLDPLGFNNTFVILIRGEEAKNLNLRTISEIAPYTPNWRAGFGAAFLDREDGYRGLKTVYGLRFAESPRAMDVSLTYLALAENRVDLISGDTTNGLIAKLDLFPLEDDRHYFPPYLAVPVIRTEVLERHPQLRPLFARLSGIITNEEMRHMNYQADVEQKPAPVIVNEFFSRHPEILGKEKEER